ncbi:uncharacterized protein H6S33_001299 [Morchella sextelata]|jgi:hypothetical protein|uniref:Anaphase-promoting complex subunit CDC26 n=1 Tax=Morchella conica CCBAS932 TaxID=1392247 RepID=A0A3N4KV00_9PEZI|nr:uncharacterized protein H6S33_001299 [Morchella sextelata]KAH0609071.1 hypothetical protein H6S33_001299 [Morchella sextelata]RPB14357.1 hypothetical protein P167DRAFT_534191 [Morchella conica CCBAS932]
MLRRKPTPIKLTTDDLILYDEFKKAQDTKSEASNSFQESLQKVPVAVDQRVRQKTREERMGVRQ